MSLRIHDVLKLEMVQPDHVRLARLEFHGQDARPAVVQEMRLAIGRGKWSWKLMPRVIQNLHSR